MLRVGGVSPLHHGISTPDSVFQPIPRFAFRFRAMPGVAVYPVRHY